jgi:hypothetical protein
MTSRRRLLAVAIVLSTVLAGCGNDHDDRLAARRAEVAEHGAHVMPFDVNTTTHRFRPTGDGLVETVVADDPTDTAQVELIRQHLAHEAGSFAHGDYSDPAAIHGDTMPGLTELEAGADRIDVTYSDETAGGRITYSTADPALVAALRTWGQAQTTDHG